MSVVELDEKIQEVDIQYKASAAGSDNRTENSSDIVSASLTRGSEATTSSYVRNLKEDDLRIILSIRIKVRIAFVFDWSTAVMIVVLIIILFGRSLHKLSRPTSSTRRARMSTPLEM